MDNKRLSAIRKEIICNYSIAIGQAIEYYAKCDDQPGLGRLFGLATAIYTQVNKVADEAIAEINKPPDKEVELK
jgi:hypothetical protein